MSFRERVFELTTAEEVDEFLAKFPTGAIFKAGGCHKTMEGFGVVEEALVKRPEIRMGFIRVIESRPASNHVAELTGITHESPQFILFIEGRPVFDVDNWEIQPELMHEALVELLGEASGGGAVAQQGSDLSSYVGLLQKYIEGVMPEEEFEAAWLTAFQMDAEARSREEFEVLNSLYGDVDQAMQGVSRIGVRPLKERAAELLQMLNS